MARAPNTWVVRTELNHVLIYHGEPVRDPVHGWPLPGRPFRAADGSKGRCVERFCDLVFQFLDWELEPNVPTRVTLQ